MGLYTLVLMPAVMIGVLRVLSPMPFIVSYKCSCGLEFINR